MLPLHQQQTRWGAVCREVLALVPESGEPASLARLQEQAGLSSDRIKQALNSLADDGVVRKTPEGEYSTPEELVQKLVV